jgi:hypothetical protein
LSGDIVRRVRGAASCRQSLAAISCATLVALGLAAGAPLTAAAARGSDAIAASGTGASCFAPPTGSPSASLFPTIPPLPVAAGSDAVNHQVAVREVRGLEAHVVVLKSKWVTAKNPAARPKDILNVSSGYKNSIDLYRYYRLPGTVARFAAQLRPVRGEDCLGLELGKGAHVRDLVVIYLPNHPVKGLVGADVQVSAAKAKGGGVAVRVDWSATWMIDRPGWERIPSGTAKIEVQAGTGRNARTLATVTSQSDVSTIVDDINNRELVQPVTQSLCGVGGALFTLRFFGATGAQPVAQAAENSCGGLNFALGARQGLALFDGSGFTATQTSGVLWTTHVLDPCNVNQLSIADANTQSADGFNELALTLSYAGPGAYGQPGPCVLAGPLQIQAHDSAGNPIGTQITGVTGPQAILQQMAVLDPGDQAAVALIWQSPGFGCAQPPAAANLGLSFADEPSPFDVSLATISLPIDPCGGKLTVLGPGNLL